MYITFNVGCEAFFWISVVTNANSELKVISVSGYRRPDVYHAGVRVHVEVSDSWSRRLYHRVRQCVIISVRRFDHQYLSINHIINRVTFNGYIIYVTKVNKFSQIFYRKNKQKYDRHLIKKIELFL